MNDLTISEIIRKVQQELVKSEELRRNAGIPPIFQTKSFDLTIAFEIKKDVGGKGSVNLAVVTADLGASAEKTSTHSVTLHFEVQGMTQNSEATGVYPDKYES